MKEAFAAEGAFVYVTDLDGAAAETVAAGIVAKGGQAWGQMKTPVQTIVDGESAWRQSADSSRDQCRRHDELPQPDMTGCVLLPGMPQEAEREAARIDRRRQRDAVLKSITPADIQTAAKRYLDDSKSAAIRVVRRRAGPCAARGGRGSPDRRR